MKWNYKDLNVFLDVSTYCNAGCPQCHRTNDNGLGKQDWLPLIQWDLDAFRKAFPPKELSYIALIDFCGTWGDPAMCKDLDKIFKYIIENSKTKITMNTNGSIRDEEWWWNVGILCGKRLIVTFDVDGINQSMHEKYRRFTSLEKVLNNMYSLSQTKSIVTSQTILFKHNQDYQNEIRSLVKEYGSCSHTFVVSDRFERKNSIDGARKFINENGNEEYLEEADGLKDGIIAGTRVSQLESKIICRWAMPRNEVVINPDGQVLPCCYHANGHYKFKFDHTYGKELNHHPVYQDDYNKNEKQYNVFYTPLSEIMQSKWYNETLPNSIKGDNPVFQCVKQCSSKIKKQHQLRVTNDT